MGQSKQPSNPQQDRGREQPPPRPDPQSSQGLIPRWAWSATAVLVLLAAYTTWRSQRMSKQFADLEEHATEEQQLSQALQSEQLNYQQILNIVAAKSTKRIQFKPAPSSSAAASASAPLQKSPNPAASRGAGANENVSAMTAYLNSQMGLVLSADKMSAMPSGHTLQLWILSQGRAPVRAAIFRPDANGQILLVIPATPEMASAKSLSISDEPAGASSQPTVTPAWTASVP
jgi:hypothetical protein